MENEAERRVTVRSLELSLAQAMNEMASSGMEDVRARSFRQSTREEGPEGFHYKSVFCANEGVKFPVLEEPEMAAGKMLRQKAVRGRVQRSDAEQQTFTACLQSKLKYYERQPALRSTLALSGVK